MKFRTQEGPVAKGYWTTNGKITIRRLFMGSSSVLPEGTYLHRSVSI